MRGMAVGVLLGAVVLTAAAPAPAFVRFHDLSRQVSATGGVTITWHGDPARGCARAGLCGYRGSTGVRPGAGGYLELLYSNGRLVDGFGLLPLVAAPVIRVQRAEESGAAGACVDLAPAGELFVNAAPARSRRVRLGFASGGMSPGRCAGPDISVALTKLRRHRVSVSRLTRRGELIDLSGRSSFVSGRFSGTAVSTVKLRIGPDDSGSGFSIGPPRDQTPVREVHVHARYRVTGFRGKLSATFRGRAAPLCENLDDCGVTGSVSWAILSAGGILAVDGYAPARASDHGVRAALAAVRRRGFFSAYGTLRHAIGTTAAAVTRPDGTPCRDTATVAAPALASLESGRREVALLLGGYESDRELLRTGCPGPPGSDVIGDDSPASGRLGASVFARRRLELPLTGGGRFEDAGYSGAWRSRFTLGLRRVGLSVSYRRVPVPR